MKKTLSRMSALIISCSLMLSVIAPAAALNSNQDIKGTVLFGNNSRYYSGETVSYEQNPDGSYTIYGYFNGELTEENTVTPGSGCILHSTYENGALVSQNVERTLENQPTTYQLGDSVPETPLGSMHYRGPLELISISCTLKQESHTNQKFTLYENTAKTLADWVAFIVSAYLFTCGAPAFAEKIIQSLQDNGFLVETVIGGSIVWVLKKVFTVNCTYYNQEIWGRCTSHSGLEPAYVEGTIVYYQSPTGTKVYREGYTTELWRTGELGRRMFWLVWGTEYNPTSWSDA